MAYLIDKLSTSTLGYKGEQPVYHGSDPTSTLHYTYSIDGNPKQIGKVPTPSKLSRGGADFVRYLDVTVAK